MPPLSAFLHVKVLETATYTVLKSEMTQAFKNFFIVFVQHLATASVFSYNYICIFS